jgi:hypothetical protein
MAVNGQLCRVAEGLSYNDITLTIILLHLHKNRTLVRILFKNLGEHRLSNCHMLALSHSDQIVTC